MSRVQQQFIAAMLLFASAACSEPPRSPTLDDRQLLLPGRVCGRRPYAPLREIAGDEYRLALAVPWHATQTMQLSRLTALRVDVYRVVKSEGAVHEVRLETRIRWGLRFADDDTVPLNLRKRRLRPKERYDFALYGRRGGEPWQLIAEYHYATRSDRRAPPTANHQPPK